MDSGLEEAAEGRPCQPYNAQVSSTLLITIAHMIDSGLSPLRDEALDNHRIH